MSTVNKKFLIKNGLAVGGATGIVDIVDEAGNWIGPNGIGATGAQGASGADGATGAAGATGPGSASTTDFDFGSFKPVYTNNPLVMLLEQTPVDMGTFTEPADFDIELGTF